MRIIKALNLACPIDGEKLIKNDGQYVCERGHTYDIARQGYVNLLPVQHKRSMSPGDSKAMVVARTQFLNAGYYQRIAEKLTETVLRHIINDKDHCIMDAGCGEGYYFDFLYHSLTLIETTSVVSFVGLDISKEAVVQAAKRNKQICWVVGTNRQPPVEEASVDIIICLFGFIHAEGFNKVLKPGGRIILVGPGAEHLAELREIIYPDVKKPVASSDMQNDIAGFSLLETERLKFKLNIVGKEQINDLLLMTPHFYRASKEGREFACELEELDVGVDVVFRVLQKL